MHVANPSVYGTETYVMGVQNTGRNFEVAKRENSVILLEENYEEKYENFDPQSLRHQKWFGPNMLNTTVTLLYSFSP